MKKVLRVFAGYGLFFAIIAAYVFLSAFWQIIFRISPLISTMISDIITITCCCVAYFYYTRNGVFFEDQQQMTKQLWGRYITLFIFASVAILLGFLWIAIYFPDLRGKSNTKSFTTDLQWILYYIHCCLLAPVCEEFLMRLCCHNMLKRYVGVVISAVSVSFVFGVLHGTFSHLIFGTLFGLFMTIVYEYTGRWYMSIAGHCIYNIFTLCCGRFLIYFASNTFIVFLMQITLLILMFYECVRVYRLRTGI